MPLLIRNHSELLVQTVIVPGDKTSEGQLIKAVTIPWFDIVALLQKDPERRFSNLSREVGRNNSWCLSQSRI